MCCVLRCPLKICILQVAGSSRLRSSDTFRIFRSSTECCRTTASIRITSRPSSPAVESFLVRPCLSINTKSLFKCKDCAFLAKHGRPHIVPKILPRLYKVCYFFLNVKAFTVNMPFTFINHKPLLFFFLFSDYLPQ